ADHLRGDQRDSAAGDRAGDLQGGGGMRRWLLFVVLYGCGNKPLPILDSGTEDAGVQDAGVDAGMMRVKGIDPPLNWSLALAQPPDAGATADVSMALDQFQQPMIAALIVDPNG